MICYPRRCSGSSKAAAPRPERHTGHVPAVYEAPAHRGAVQQDSKYSEAVWSPWRSGGATTEQTHGEEGEQGKLGKQMVCKSKNKVSASNTKDYD